MCNRPFVGKEENFYLQAYPIAAELSDGDIHELFSVFGQIQHLEVHRVFIRDKAVDGHCFIGFGELAHAVKALQFGKNRGKFRFETELIVGKFSLKYRH